MMIRWFTTWRWLAVFLAAVAPAVAMSAQSSPSDSSLYAAREAVWRSFFANDPDLARTLPAEFVAIEDGDSLWRGRREILAEARESAEAGTRLVSLRFPRNVLQRYGNVAVIHSRYEAVLANGSENQALRGRITELFVWDGTRWIHPSWNMRIEDAPDGGP